jgi:hypothetical protein
MSRPQKIHKPIKGSFTQIINAVADGKGVKTQAKDRVLRKESVQASEPPPPKAKGS